MCAQRLDKLKGDEQLALCKRYFFIGCFGLPFVWFINFIWFFNLAFKHETFAQQGQIKKCKAFNIFLP